MTPDSTATKRSLYAVVFVPLGVAAVAEELGQGARDAYNQTYKSWGLALGELSDMATSGHPRWSDWADRSRRHTYEEWIEAITEVWARVWSGPIRHPSLSDATLQCVKDVPKLSDVGRRAVGFQPNLFARANFREVAHEAARLAVDEWGTATANALGTSTLPTGDLLRLSSSGFPPCLVSRRPDSDEPGEVVRALTEFNDSSLSGVVELCHGHPHLEHSAYAQLVGYQKSLAAIVRDAEELTKVESPELISDDQREQLRSRLEDIAVNSFENRAVDGAPATVQALIRAHRIGLKKFSQTRIGAALAAMPRLTHIMERHCRTAGQQGVKTWDQFSEGFAVRRSGQPPLPQLGSGPHAPSR